MYFNTTGTKEVLGNAVHVVKTVYSSLDDPCTHLGEDVSIALSTSSGVLGITSARVDA